MDRKNKSLGNQVEVGGPEEDRTPDLLIAKDAVYNHINDLGSRRDAIKSPKPGGECTNRAQVSGHDHMVFFAMPDGTEKFTTVRADTGGEAAETAQAQFPGGTFVRSERVE